MPLFPYFPRSQPVWYSKKHRSLLYIWGFLGEGNTRIKKYMIRSADSEATATPVVGGLLKIGSSFGN
jgi:hypothetical protein